MQQRECDAARLIEAEWMCEKFVELNTADIAKDAQRGASNVVLLAAWRARVRQSP